MSVYYKFKSNLEFDKVTFDGLHISVGELKKQILQQKKIGKSNDLDLQITDAQTKAVYTSDDQLIQKNTSVIVCRVPLTLTNNKKRWKVLEPNNLVVNETHISLDKIIKSSDLSNLDESEEQKLQTIMTQSTQDYDSSRFVKTRSMIGPVPANYICYRCGKAGHYIKHCPTNQNDVKRSTGIPRCFMMPAKADQRGALITSTGEYVVPIIDHEAYKKRKKEKPPFVPNENSEIEEQIEQIPDELQCLICKNILQDAVMIPCCSNCYCDDCIRTCLLESDQHKCPSCSTFNVSPDALLPNRYLRNKVHHYKNENIYFLNNKANQINYQPTKSSPNAYLTSKASNDLSDSPPLNVDSDFKDEQKDLNIKTKDSPLNNVKDKVNDDSTSQNESQIAENQSIEEMETNNAPSKSPIAVMSDEIDKDTQQIEESNDKSNSQNGSSGQDKATDGRINLQIAQQPVKSNPTEPSQIVTNQMNRPQSIRARRSILGYPPNQMNQQQPQQSSQRIYSSQANYNFNNNPQQIYQNSSNYSSSNYQLQRGLNQQMHSAMSSSNKNHNNAFNHHGYNQLHPGQMMRHQQYASNYYGPQDMYSNYNGYNQMHSNYRPIDSQYSSMNSGYCPNYMDQRADRMFSRHQIDQAYEDKLDRFAKDLEKRNHMDNKLQLDYHRRVRSRSPRSKSRQHSSRIHHTSSYSRIRSRSTYSSRSTSRSYSRSRSHSVYHKKSHSKSSKSPKSSNEYYEPVDYAASKHHSDKSKLVDKYKKSHSKRSRSPKSRNNDESIDSTSKHSNRSPLEVKEVESSSHRHEEKKRASKEHNSKSSKDKKSKSETDGHELSSSKKRKKKHKKEKKSKRDKDSDRKKKI